jgi:1-acyl-sn-glycerol-3-phosphate acyltransferase
MKIHYITPRILQTLIWIPTRLVFILFSRIKIYGKENLKGLKGGAIFASNHASEMDPIMIPATLTPFSPLFPMFYVSRGSDFYTTSGWRQKIYGGLFFALWGAYPAHPGRHNYEEALKNHIEILLKKKSIHIFPEGRKSKSGEISNKIHGGAAFLSWKTGVPIIPVSIKGTFQTTLARFFTGKKKYIVSFGKPLYPKDLFKNLDKEPTKEEYKEAIKKS